MFAAFFASGMAHALLVFMAIGDWSYSLANGAFFCVQPVFIVIERRMKIKLWPPAARRAWTISVLAVTSPLFVAPVLQVVGRGWALPDALHSIVPVLSFVFFVVILFSLASLVSCPEPTPSAVALEPKPAP